MDIKYKFLIFFCAICLSIITLVCSPMFGLNIASWHMLGLVMVMVIFWISEVIPPAVTAIIPIIYAPLVGLDTLSNVTAPYAHPIIFLFLGGLSMGLAIEKCGLHERIALTILSKMGNNYKKQLLGFMIASAGISMWISNTATAAMLLPVVLAVIASMPKSNSDVHNSNFSKALLIGMAYAASIGGAATLIGTPPNVLLKGFLATQSQYNISFLGWLIFALPLVIIMLVVTYVLIIRLFKLDKIDNVNFDYNKALKELGTINLEQVLVAILFTLTAFCWIFKIYINNILHLKLTDEIIAVIALFSLFIVPSPKRKKEALLVWEDMKEISWDVLLLFGGGLSLAQLFITTGLTTWVASSLDFIANWPLLAIIALVAVILKFLTELTSNTATTAATLPVFFTLAIHSHINPLYITIPLAMSASLAFMMPIGTPPNAIVYASGKLQIKDMLRVGFILNIISIILMSVYIYYIAPLVFK